MRIERISGTVGDDVGLDFAEFFSNEDLVCEAIEMLAAHLDGANCYCLSFKCIDGGDKSVFEPYVGNGRPNGLITQAHISLPKTIPYWRLVNTGLGQVGDDAWPPIGKWRAIEGEGCNHPNEFDGARFVAQLRLQVGTIFVGVFKIVWPRDSAFPYDFEFALNNARNFVQMMLRTRIPELRVQRILVDDVFRADLSETIGIVHQLISSGNVRLALQIVCSLVTGHVGGEFNRVVCLVPDRNPLDLRCVWAHGNDSSGWFSDNLQGPLSRQTSKITDFVRQVRSGPFPPDDLLYKELAQGPRSLYVKHEICSFVTEVWRNADDLSKLSDATVVIHKPSPKVNLARRVVIRRNEKHILAAKIPAADPVLSGDFRRIWRSNLNNQYYAIPWLHGQTPIALMIVDMCCWQWVNDGRDIISKLLVTEALLSEFAPLFQYVDLGSI